MALRKQRIPSKVVTPNILVHEVDLNTINLKPLCWVVIVDHDA
jgi:hypothetical protein